MHFRRNAKNLFALLVLAACVAMSGSPAIAAYPDRVIKIIVPFAPGGGTDAIARVLAQEMAKDLGTSIIIENKPGAGTIIGAQAVASAEGDGYTLLMGSFAHAVNPSLNARLPFDPNKDFAPVALVARSPNIVVVNPKSSFRSIADLIAAAKAEPEKISYGTFGTGTSAHLAGEMFKHMARVNMTMVPYKGSAPAITDLIGGQVQVLFSTYAAIKPQVDSGKMRVLAVAEAKRLPEAPQVPTFAETFPGFEMTTWFGVFAPAGTPQPIVDRLAKELDTILARPDIREKFVKVGLPVVAEGPEAFRARIAKEVPMYKDIIDRAGLKIK
jgi:tripartite-type tricarboxylate transporter receptor subunit TctC